MWLQGYLGKVESIKGNDDFNQTYMYISWACAIGILTFFALGKWNDEISPKVIIPFSFLMRGTALILISQADDPSSVTSILLWVLFANGYLL